MVKLLRLTADGVGLFCDFIQYPLCKIVFVYKSVILESRKMPEIKNSTRRVYRSESDMPSKDKGRVFKNSFISY